MSHPRHWQHKPPPWVEARSGKRRFLFWRFAAGFGGMLLLFLTSLLVIYILAERPLRQAFPRPIVMLTVLCGIPLVFIFLSSLVGGLFFRRVGSPVADVMAAADAVAEGDLSVRVREDLTGELGDLARSFNRMTAELARAEQQRRNLTADVAHELRTPLHILQGNLEGILDGVYQPTPEQINAMLEETRFLTRLVNDLQTLSLAEAGELPLHKEQVSAAGLIEDTITGFSGPAAAAGVELSAELPAQELNLYGDPDRLSQVLTNLVSNALRYTPSGGRITLRADALPAEIRLTVQDTGAGIPPEDLPYIFDRFWRGDRARSRQPGAGSGLGLAIARQLVQAHGGQIRAESVPGQGTRFIMTFPQS